MNSPISSYSPDPNLQKQAEAAIVRFEKSIAPSVWMHLNKQQIVTEIRARVKNPFQINQGGQPFCGPAAVLFELIRKQPVRYVELCQNLFLVGGFHTTSGKWIPAPDHLRDVSKGELRMPQVDWMVLASLREAENLLFPVEPNAPDIIRNLAGMTKSWEMKGWVKEILGYPKVEYNHAYLGGLNALKEGQEAIASGGVAFALITAEGMLTNNPPPVAFPTHWIVLLGGIATQNARVSFDIYTWSRQMRIDLSEGDFKRYLWAIVTGKS